MVCKMSQEEIEVEAIGVEVASQPIELYKVLKIANAVSGGGEAKFVIAEGYVAVNGELEQRKRCKVYDGDVIEFNNEYYVVLCDQPVDESPKVTEPKPAKPEKHAKKPAGGSKAAAKSQAKKTAKSKPAKNKKPKAGAEKKSGPADKATGRRPINF